MKRANSYSKAGADLIMIHSKQKKPTEIFKFAKKFKKSRYAIPLVSVPTSYSNTYEKDLIKNGIFFAGIDFIDEKLNGDINVTSPTGLKTLFDLTKINLAKTFWNKLKA